MRRLLRPLWFLVALVFLFEAWLWDRLEPIAAWLARHVAWAALRAQIAAGVGRLPPYGTLPIFFIPVATLFPLKLAGMWLLAHGSVMGGASILVAAKFIGMGFTAFIFDVTRDKLLQIGWFRWVYRHVIVWRALARRLVDPYKRAIREWIDRATAPARLRLRKLLWLARPGRTGRFLRRMTRIRRRMHAANVSPPPGAPRGA